MSYRKTWAQVKNQVGQPIGLDGNHPDLLPLFNQSSEELWDEGDWVGKNQRYKVRVTGDCHGNRTITWPHAVETIEAVNICNRPIGVRNVYFEFSSNAVGQIGTRDTNRIGGFGNGISLLGDRQEVCTNEDIVRGGKRLRIYTERIEDSGRILLLGYDDSDNWIRTFQNNCWQDGEYLNLADSPATTLSHFSAVTGVQFDKTPRNGNTYLYTVDAEDNQRQIATYEYSLDIPVFRRSILSGLPTQPSQSECVTILAKMRYVPVMFDTDYVQIGNVSAMKAMLQYIYKRDSDKIQDAEAYKEAAVDIMNQELKQYNGYGAKKMLNFGPKNICGTSRNLF